MNKTLSEHLPLPSFTLSSKAQKEKKVDSPRVLLLYANDLGSDEGASVVVGEGTDDDEDDIDDVPNTESSGSGELQQRRDDVSEVEAVNSIR